MTENTNTPASVWPTESSGFADLHENIITIYGIPKIGKTTLASQFPDALFMRTEDGTKHVKVRGWAINKWLDFCEKIGTIEANAANRPFKTVVIDTVDNLTEMCDQFICKKYSLNILGDLEFGKGYSYYIKEFKKQIGRITALGLGVVFISHADEKRVSVDSIANPYAPLSADFSTGTVNMVVPTMERRSMEFILGLSDIILYLELDANNHRVIRTKPTKHFQAGDRSGRLPDTLPLDYNQLLLHYYGDSTTTARTELCTRITKAVTYMAQKQIDGFHTPKRADASANKHLGTDVSGISAVDDIATLENYLQHLNMKIKTFHEKPN